MPATSLPVEPWVLAVLIAAVPVLGLLGVLTAFIEEQKMLHEARISADRVRRQYAAQAAAQEADGEVDIVETPPAEAVPLRRAA